MAISNNLQPKEIEFLKFQKSRWFNAEESFTKLQIARDKWLFTKGISAISSTSTTPVSKSSSITSEQMQSNINPNAFSLDKLKQMTNAVKEQEEESDEWFTGFISESKEALWQRVENVKDIWQRFDTKVQEWWEKLEKALKEEWLWAAFVQSMKNQLNILWSSFQWAWQVVWAWTDLIWEWLENAIQEFTPAQAEQAIENVVKSAAESGIAQDIWKSYMTFREKNPELARNIEAVWNISTLLPTTKQWRAIIKETAKEVVKAPVTIPAKITANTIRIITPESIANKIAWIDVDTAKVIKNTPKQKLDEVLTQAQNSIDDVWNVPSPFSIAWKKAEEALWNIVKLKQEAWKKKSSLLKWVENKTIDTLDIKQEFDKLIAERFNLELDPETLKLKEIPWEISRIKDLWELQDLTDDLLEIFTTDKINLKNLDALVDRMQDWINFKKVPWKEASVSTKTIKTFIETNINKRLKEVAGIDFENSNAEFRKYLELQGDLEKLLWLKWSRVEWLMKSVFSPQTWERTSKIFRQIKEELWIDLIEEAKLAKFAMEAVWDTRWFNLLEALDLWSWFSQSKLWLIQNALQSVFSPEKVAKNLSKKSTILEKLNIK